MDFKFNFLSHNPSYLVMASNDIFLELRLEKIYQAAIDSVGCPVGPAIEFEAELLVEKLNQVKTSGGTILGLSLNLTLWTRDDGAADGQARINVTIRGKVRSSGRIAEKCSKYQ
jgi:hypothetical protein